MPITVNRARKLLGKTSKKFSDNDIGLLINQFYGIAEIVSEMVGSKKTTKGIESTQKKEDYGKD
jgi:hypothetical protein